MEYVLYLVALVVGFGLGYYVRDLKKPAPVEVATPKKRAYNRKSPAKPKTLKVDTSKVVDKTGGSTSAVAGAIGSSVPPLTDAQRQQMLGMQNDPNNPYGRGLENAFGAGSIGGSIKTNGAAENKTGSAP